MRPDAVENRERCLKALRNFRDAAIELNGAWDYDTMNRRDADSEYPFGEKKIARAAEIYAWTGHDELFKATAALLRHAHLARETVALAIEAKKRARSAQ